MSSTQSDRIGIAAEQIAQDKEMSVEQRNDILDMLMSAGHAANGAPDKLQSLTDAVGSIAVFLARQAHRQDIRLAEAVLTHSTNCPLRSGVSGKLAVIFPYRWQIAVVLCVALISPYAGPELAKMMRERSVENQVKVELERLSE